MRSLYRALGIRPGADEAQIKAAFRQLAKRSHPDLNAGDTDSSERFKEIHQAYRLLRDPQTRAVLDFIAVEARAVDRRRWLMTVGTMAIAFVLTLGGGLLFLVWQPGPEPRPAGHQVSAVAEEKTSTAPEQQRDGEGKTAKPARHPAADVPAAEVPGQRITATAPLAAQADDDAIGKQVATDEAPRPLDAARWAPAPTAPSPAAERHAEWRTYQNDRFGFSLKYPAHVFTVVSGKRGDEVLFVSHDGRARLRVSGTRFSPS